MGDRHVTVTCLQLPGEALPSVDYEAAPSDPCLFITMGAAGGAQGLGV